MCVFCSHHWEHGRVQTRHVYGGRPAGTHAVAAQENQGKDRKTALSCYLTQEGQVIGLVGQFVNLEVI